MTFNLKPIHKDAITNALAKADKYRTLNDPCAAESICVDILMIEPDDQQAIVTLILTLTDQFRCNSRVHINQVREHLPKLTDEYMKAYYAGIICERWGHAKLDQNTIGSGPMAYDSLVEAMRWYEKAEKIHPPGNDDAILRYNTCVRLIQRHKLAAHADDGHEPYFD